MIPVKTSSAFIASTSAFASAPFLISADQGRSQTESFQPSKSLTSSESMVFLLNALAKAQVPESETKENENQRYENEIEHFITPQLFRRRSRRCAARRIRTLRSGHLETQGGEQSKVELTSAQSATSADDSTSLRFTISPPSSRTLSLSPGPQLGKEFINRN